MYNAHTLFLLGGKKCLMGNAHHGIVMVGNPKIGREFCRKLVSREKKENVNFRVYYCVFTIFINLRYTFLTLETVLKYFSTFQILYH